MTEQQDHLQQLLQQRQQLVNEYNALSEQMTSKRETILKLNGAIEYLQEIGVRLPEPEVEPEAEVTETEE